MFASLIEEPAYSGARIQVAPRPDQSLDFATFSLRLTVMQLIVLVVQVGTDAEVEAFQDPATPEASKIAIAHGCFKKSIDTPVFLTFPSKSTPIIAQHAPVIIYLEDKVFGVALTMSNAVGIDMMPDFALRHPMLQTHEQQYVIKVCIFCALASPITWRQAMTMPRLIDASYFMDDNTREALFTHVDRAFDTEDHTSELFGCCTPD